VLARRCHYTSRPHARGGDNGHQREARSNNFPTISWCTLKFLVVGKTGEQVGQVLVPILVEDLVGHREVVMDILLVLELHLSR